MVEYGAPLVQAWVNEGKDNERQFLRLIADEYAGVVRWINDSGLRCKNLAVEMNLYGIVPLKDRFI